MAGGADWYLKSRCGAGDTYQKEKDGPWFYRDGLEIVISQKVKADFLNMASNEQGTVSGVLTFMVGTVTKTITKAGAEKFVCKADNVTNDQPVGKYVTREQTWLWRSTVETEIK